METKFFCDSYFIGSHAFKILLNISEQEIKFEIIPGMKMAALQIEDKNIENINSLMEIIDSFLQKDSCQFRKIFCHRNCNSLHQEIEELFNEIVIYFQTKCSKKHKESICQNLFSDLKNLCLRLRKLVENEMLCSYQLLLLECIRAFNYGLNMECLELQNFEYDIFQIFSLRKYVFDNSLLYFHISEEISNRIYAKFLIFKDKGNDLQDCIRCHNLLFRKKKLDFEGKEFSYDETMNLWLTPTFLEEEKIIEIRNKSLLWNKLSVNMKHKKEIIFKKLRDLGADKEDKLLSKLMEIFEEKDKIPDNLKGKIDLVILRNDFLHDFGLQEWLQVEINMMASGSPINGDNTKDVLKYLYQHYFPQEKLYDPTSKRNCEMIKAFDQTMEIYGNKKGFIVFFVPENESNIYDQRILEFELNKIGYQFLLIKSQDNTIDV